VLTFLHLYRALIRSKLDCGCIVYGSARPSYLKMLDHVQNSALRLCRGAFRTSPASSMSNMASEPLLQLRRQKLTLQYCVELASNPCSPDYSFVFNPQHVSSLPRNQTRLLHLVFVPLRCFEILVLSERTLSLTKSPLLHPGCWQGQSLILSCTVMTSCLLAIACLTIFIENKQNDQ